LLHNSSETCAGAFYVFGKENGKATKVKMTDTAFKENSCRIDGGALVVSGNTQIVCNDSKFSGNMAGGSCGAVSIHGKDAKHIAMATFRTTDFSNNKALLDGGALVLNHYTRSKFDGCSWQQNSAEEKTAGAILILGKESHPTIAEFIDFRFTQNTCQIDGGAINVNIHTQTIFDRGIFSQNQSKMKNGGAVVLLGRNGQSSTKATFHQVEFRENTCYISGGAVNANDYTKSYFDQCVFQGNHAVSKNGGAILILGEHGQYPSEAKFEKVEFIENNCKGSGGAVNANIYSITSFLSCRFSSNCADVNGGGICIRGVERFPNKSTIQECFFVGNIAGKIGADVALKAVKGVTTETLLKDNTIEIPAPDFYAEDMDD
jgi:predicted outer membrane repeat protein